mgnify:CR=1 FL=1
MKIMSFNVNSIRVRLHQLQAVIERHAPDIIALQETKVMDEDFPVAAIEALGYQAVWHGQKTHYGVATLSRLQASQVQKGFIDENTDAQRRVLMTTYEQPAGKRIHVVNGYFPQGESRSHPVKFPNKERFYADLHRYLECEAKNYELLTVVGDMNVAPADADIGIGAENAQRWLRAGKCSFLPEERAWLEQLKKQGLVDCYRQVYPDANDHFSWFDYRSRGFERDPKRGLRIDLILASCSLAQRCTGAGIDYDVRAMGKPSDHAPVWAEFDLS